MTVFVFGNCTVDVFFKVDRFPIEGETLLASSRYVDLGGKGANQAVVAGRCGSRCVLVAPLGGDPEGALARSRLDLEPLDTGRLISVPAPTDQSIIYIRPDGANCIVSSHDAAASLTPSHCAAALAEAVPGDIVLLQGNLSLETTRHCLAEARECGATTLLNPAPVAFPCGDLWPLVDLAILNEVEAAELGGDADPARAAAALRAAGAREVIVTLGSRGATFAGPEGAHYVPAPVVEVVDTAGAGDVFCGVVAGCLDRGLLPADALARAVSAASLAVTRSGTQSSFPDAGTLSRLLSEPAP
ncbi:ribokinase [Skermanella aerolata]|uniref:Ribokinase n=1 Tax=Skermanella aerolata TaxID=393310 RepID=A0A512DIU4_9PROT|nr:ribokinase [Skermanella aerolata]KJB97408.1 carbohydrate kinase [Skermanella aerolata KACC 11604]GEO36401.1 ribokinase [Skermanella aerolata]